MAIKTKIQKVAVWGVFGLTFLAIYMKHRIDSIGLSLRNLTLISYDSDTKTALLNLVVSVRYPLPFDVLAKHLTGMLYIQGAPVASIDTEVNRYLRSDAENLMTIPVSVDITQLGTGIWNNIQTGNVRTLMLQLDARLTTNVIPISLHRVLTWEDLTR